MIIIVYAKYTKFNLVFRPYIMKCLDLITRRVENPIQEVLPSKIGIVFDGCQ